MLPVAVFLLGLVGFGIQTGQLPEVELRAGAHRTHATETIRRATAGVAAIVPLRHGFFGVQFDAAYSQRASLTCWGWGETAAPAPTAFSRADNVHPVLAQTAPCPPDAPDLTRFDDRSDLSVLARLTVPSTGDRLQVHFLVGPTVSLPYRCELEHRGTGERRGCSLDTDLVLTLGMGLGVHLSERLGFALGARYGLAPNYYGDTGGGRHDESSLLAGLAWRPG